MTVPGNFSCDQFDQGVDELAVGTLAEPERGLLLDHAASCPACEARLNWLAGVADRLLLLVPEVEPPPGFEAGVMARIRGAATDRPAGPPSPATQVGPGGPATRGAGPAHTATPATPAGPAGPANTATPPVPGRRGHPARTWPRRSWRLVAAAAVAVAVLGAGIALGRSSNRSKPAAVARQGEIITIGGMDVGTAQVINTAQPHVLLSLKGPLPWGVLNCQLETAQGQRVTIGSWDYEDNPDGTWAARIDRSLTRAVRMRIIDQQGAVVATASLT